MSEYIPKKESVYLKKPWLEFYPEGVSHQIEIPSLTIFDLLERTVSKYPSKIALIDGERNINYSDLKLYCERVAISLYKQGFRKGDRIALMIPTSLEYVISFFAIQRLGAVVVQLNPNFQPAEIESLLRNSETNGLIAFHEEKDKLMKTGLTNHIKFISADEDRKEDMNLYKWINNETDKLIFSEVFPEDLAIITFTGGTTGFPKGVMITHLNLVSNLYQSFETNRQLLQLEGHCQLGISPVYHGMGLFSLIQAVMIGASFVSIRKFEIKHLLDLIRIHRPTIFTGSPTTYIALLNNPDRKKEDLSCFKICVCGSAPLPIEVIKSFAEQTGVQITEGYGLSEATTGAIRNPFSGKKKVGSVGLPMPNTDVRIVDTLTGENEIPVGEQGEIIIKGPQVMKGYWKNQQETEKTIRNGWLYTGDIGIMDEEGYFYIVGRKKEMIITGGFNVYPVEIENVIYQHPAVQEACVYGVPDPYRGETIKVAIALKNDFSVTVEEIQTWCKERLTRYKIPRIVEFRKSLPKTTVGKILRKQLKDEEINKVDT
ncbi:long-chain-fatty-acid--CoA ligase [Gottfriedia acidiceleris]|uniref:long-chain-fatty-acid--CoA ligase n=1 Tax=Gottfriedia acidiceleris TaxID=371036 RepID=UPI003D23FAD9